MTNNRYLKAIKRLLRSETDFRSRQQAKERERNIRLQRTSQNDNQGVPAEPT